MKKSETRISMRKYAARAVIFTVLVVLVANAAYMFMRWLIDDVIEIANPYLGSEFKFLGTFIIVNILLVIGFVIIYTRRRRELTKLSNAIEGVSSGDYSVHIEFGQRDSMAQVYNNFNKMSDELASVQILRKDFINNFSHEFKTPIASINGFASLMLEKNLSEKEQKEYLSVIKEESERLSKLTNNTILLSKLSQESIYTKKEKYDLGEQIRQCSIILSNEWLDKEQTYTGDIDSVEFVGNYDLMQHVWLNVISNAVKYTPNGGNIKVSLKKIDNKAVVSIEDNGMGMDEKTLLHLFDPYYQADSAHSNEGMGLGLSIVKQIIDAYNGTIEVNSKINKGSEFIISLPIAA